MIRDDEFLALITRVNQLSQEVRDLRARVGKIEFNFESSETVVATNDSVACGAGGIAVKGSVEGGIFIAGKEK